VNNSRLKLTSDSSQFFQAVVGFAGTGLMYAAEMLIKGGA